MFWKSISICPDRREPFFTRLCEGTLEYRIRLDYILDAFSRTPAAGDEAGDPGDSPDGGYISCGIWTLVPDSAAVNEAVKLAARKGFRNLKGFVNGVRAAQRRPAIPGFLPNRERNSWSAAAFLSGIPCRNFSQKNGWRNWDRDTAEKMMAAFLKEAPLTARLRGTAEQRKKTLEELAGQGVSASPGALRKECLLSGRV